MSNERKKRKAPTHRVAPVIAGVFALAFVIILLVVPPWVIPPIQSKETGPAAIEMVQFKDGDRMPDYVIPAALPAAEPYEGEAKAGDVYENVVVLGDLSEGEFTRLMLAITEWVSPEQGCEYCHNLDEGFASDSIYTKTVARMMLQMTRNINTNWPEHVAPAGVTCYTCHRGENVPAQVWYNQSEPDGSQFLGKPRPWFLEAKTIREFFPDVPYEKYLAEDPAPAQIQSRDPLVNVSGEAEVAREQTAENLYLFMMQQSNALGVNCTYCHNSRAFYDWSQSTPFRWIGYWGIRMAREINVSYLEPLAGVFPTDRLGPQGDVAKAHCGTCHRGEAKPLNGNNLMHYYTAGLSENDSVPDPAPKEAILIGTAVPVAETGPDPDQADVAPGQVNENAIEQSVAPEGEGSNGEDVQYESQTEGGESVDAPALEEATEPLPPETPGEASPPGDAIEGAPNPQESNERSEEANQGDTNVSPAPSPLDENGDDAMATEDPGPGKAGADVGTEPPVNEGSTDQTPDDQPRVEPGAPDQPGGSDADPSQAGQQDISEIGGSSNGSQAQQGSNEGQTSGSNGEQNAGPAEGETEGGQAGSSDSQGSGGSGGTRPTVTIVPQSSN